MEEEEAEEGGELGEEEEKVGEEEEKGTREESKRRSADEAEGQTRVKRRVWLGRSGI